MRKLNIGLSPEQREGVIGLLNADLADTYLLIIKTKKHHWDVVGPQFRSLHELWEEQYQAMSESSDKIAERVRALGGYPVGTAKGFLEYATLEEHPGDIPTAYGMVARLLDDHEQVIRNLRGHVDRCSEEFGDEGTADFLTGIMEAHEDMAWMLRSFIEGVSIEPDGDKPGSELKLPVEMK
ncbi:Dps family protein [Leptolyngbya sp. FACHB-261]|uniref:Dps family protein n=1 Tax=Leptolyngbya sp. FACHB-261 TaxID=2692806 RepID=UPI001684B865|nr:Dps family protein [Leptolyngbya sp. FACHB-261]MBD2104214.1 DNA starvation/stationary phase protection protein [Leptolyngbya sp. FACHB-261]